jgi:hypothetical protein
MLAVSVREQRCTFEAVVGGMELLITEGRQYSENADFVFCRN